MYFWMMSVSTNKRESREEMPDLFFLFPVGFQTMFLFRFLISIKFPIEWYKTCLYLVKKVFKPDYDGTVSGDVISGC